MSVAAPGPVLALRIPNRLAAIGEAAEDIARFCAAHGVPEGAIGHLNLALDEAMTNTIEYGWPDGGDHEVVLVVLTIAIGDGAVMAEIGDDGVAFDPLEVPPPDLESDLESRPIGGLGVHFVKTLMDEVAYRRDGGKNVLTMRKRFVAVGTRA
jgi:serine/threonine-protein kinase RsbW